MRFLVGIQLFFFSVYVCLSGCSPEVESGGEGTRFRVRVNTREAEYVEQEIRVSAKSLPARTVTLKAQTEGPVAQIGAERGHFLQKGDLIVAIDMEDRQVRLEEADSYLRQKLLEYSASLSLHQKGFEADSKLAASQAELDQARAQKEAILLDIAHTKIDAPFNGFLDKRPVEVGDFLSVGDDVGTFIELDPLRVMGYAPSVEVLPLQLDMPGYVLFLDGTRLDGVVSYIAKESRENVRTFAIELTVDNLESKIPAGMSAELVIPFRRVLAHKVPLSAVTLDDDGAFGVKVVNEQDKVVFYPADIVKSDVHHLWIQGLPARSRIITLGQGFVRSGESVNPVEEPVLGGL